MTVPETAARDDLGKENDKGVKAPLRVSVAMTTYRARPEFLHAQLESIRDQTRPVDEVIICDDCSGDGTPVRLRSFIDANGLSDSWRIIEHDSNKHVAASMRDALAATTGDIVFLADQDDVWHPDKVEGMVRIFEAHPEVSSLLGDFHIIDARGNHMTDRRGGDNPLFFDRDQKVDEHLYHMHLATILAHNMSPGATQAVSRAVVDKFPQVKKHARMHDWRMNIIAAFMNDGLYYTDTVYTDYRLHDDNSIGLDRFYLDLPQWKGFSGRLRWTRERLATILRSTWRSRHEAYGRLTAYEFGNNGVADNMPENLEKSYFKVCRPSKETKAQFDAWTRYVKAKKRAVAKKSFLRFVKLRASYGFFHKREFSYYRWPERLASLLRDFYYSFCGPSAK